MCSPKKSWFLTVACMLMLCSMAILPSELDAQRRGESGNIPGRGDVPKRSQEMQKLQAEKQFEKICEYLELDKKQKKKARKLFDDMQKKTEKVAREMREGKLDQTEASKERIKIYLNYREKFRALLSKEQNEKYEKLRESSAFLQGGLMDKKVKSKSGTTHFSMSRFVIKSFYILCFLTFACRIGDSFSQVNFDSKQSKFLKQDIKGYVRDTETNEALPFANVLLKGTSLGAATNTDGYFVIVNAPVGKCTLQVKYIGFATKEVEIENGIGEDKTIDIEMERVVIELDGITVEGEVQTVDVSENVSQVVMAPQELLVLPNIGEVDMWSISPARPGTPMIPGMERELTFSAPTAPWNSPCPTRELSCFPHAARIPI